MNEPLSVLIVEDDPHVLLGCQQALELEDIPCIGVGSAEEALQRVDRDFAGIVVSDIRLPGIDGLTLLERLKSLDPSLPVVLITGHGDISMAVQAMHAGAYDFMEKPFSPERLVEVARRALEQRGLAREVSALRRQLAGRQDLAQRIIGRSPAIQALRELIANVGDTSANVLILGETGTGKELVARCLHDYSRRHQHAFVALNCGGLPENLFDSEIFGHEAHAFTGANKRRIGKIEHANGGTLFLDEIESMPVNLQIKLLRVLQEHTLERLGSNQSIPVDCRVIAATKARGHPAALRTLPPAVLAALRPPRAGTRPCHRGQPDGPRLAGQRTRTAQRRRTLRPRPAGVQQGRPGRTDRRPALRRSGGGIREGPARRRPGPPPRQPDPGQPGPGHGQDHAVRQGEEVRPAIGRSALFALPAWRRARCFIRHFSPACDSARRIAPGALSALPA